ncbi:MAG TPA: TolC family protein [Candidatus Gastranaerophilaceae bacterium]|nr:TolC family protein [Candidatus Gastranaerophilaceae bacterium]
MKRLLTFLLLGVFCTSMSLPALAAPVALSGAAAANVKAIKYKPNARSINYAFVFDGPSDKNEVVLKQFEKAITATTAPDYKAEFPKNLVFVGNWAQSGVKTASDKALASNATMVVSLGYLSSNYLADKKGKNKFVVTIDQYGLRDIGEGFFNPVQQSVNGIKNFKTLLSFKKAAILMNENYYKTQKDWAKFAGDKIPNINFAVIPATTDVAATMASIPSDCDAVVLTPLFNLSVEQRKNLISQLNAKKIPTYSTLGKEDVEMGVLLGTGAYDLDRKVAEMTSFNIKGVLDGQTKMAGKVNFYEDEVLYMNRDTADLIGYQPHLRVLYNAEVISNKKPTVYDLSTIFNLLETQNLDIQRKKLLVKAARRATAAAALRYLPSAVVNLGFQQYDEDYAYTVKLMQPEKTGIFQIGLEQVLYSPALVTNIIIKKKGLNFAKHEQFMVEQNMGIDIALLYIETNMLENMIKVQKEYVKEARENLAIARVREKMGVCGNEETMRWAAQVNIKEQHLLDMREELKNLKIEINKMLFKDQKEQFELAALTAKDPAFYTKDLHVINYVTTPEKLEKFTQMLIGEAFRVAPELAKLKTAIEMKNAEAAMYYQKFILPDAKLTYTYTSLMDRQFAAGLPSAPFAYSPPAGGTIPGSMWTNLSALRPGATNSQLGIFAQWRPIEGGTKIAEIARINAERQELQRYQDEVKTAIEEQIRQTINRAVAAYFSIEKNYKAMYASQENYAKVKERYLTGKAPIDQLIDAETTYLNSKEKAMNSQYVFFKELVWVQRAICAVNWATASTEAKQFIESIKKEITPQPDVSLL